MIISPLAQKTILSPNYGYTINGRLISYKRTKPVLRLTPHHTATVGATAVNIANGFANPQREASANYIIGNDGEIICCVPEEFCAWTSDSPDNDNEAITVEVCNESGAPEWRISDKALDSLINLGVDVCRRHNLNGFEWTGDKNGTLTIHKMFVATACPGPYLESKMSYIASEIKKRLQGEKKMVYNINIDDLKQQGYTEVCFKFAEQAQEPSKAPEKETINEGDTVALSPDAVVYGTQDKFAPFVYASVLFVRQIEGNRVVISTQPTGNITGAVDIKYLTKI